MLREVCSCGASITADDPHTITQSRVEDWRANHRHDTPTSTTTPPRDGHVEVRIEADTSPLLKQLEKLRQQAASWPPKTSPSVPTRDEALMMQGDRRAETDQPDTEPHKRSTAVTQTPDELRRWRESVLSDVDSTREELEEREHSLSEAESNALATVRGIDWLLGERSDTESHDDDVTVCLNCGQPIGAKDGQVFHLWPPDGYNRTHDAVPYPTQTSPHYTDCTFLSGGCCNCRPQTSPDGEASTPHATASHRSLTSVAPAGEEHGAPEPPPGTPVWWDGKWYFKGRDAWYVPVNPLTWEPVALTWVDMPGAVPALTPQQMHDRYYVPGFSNGHARGRNDAARDVEALMRWRGVWVDADDAVRAARGGE